MEGSQGDGPQWVQGVAGLDTYLPLIYIYILVEVLDELWTSNFQYPEKRFINVIGLISSGIVEKLE